MLLEHGLRPSCLLRRDEPALLLDGIGQVEFRYLLFFLAAAKRRSEGRAKWRIHVEVEIVHEFVQIAVVMLVPRSAHVRCPYSTTVLMAPLASLLRSDDVRTPWRYLLNMMPRRAMSAGSVA